MFRSFSAKSVKSLSSAFSGKSGYTYLKVQQSNDGEDEIWNPNASNDDDLSEEYGHTSDNDSLDSFDNDNSSDMLIYRGLDVDSRSNRKSRIPQFCFRSAFGMFLMLFTMLSIFFFGWSAVEKFFNHYIVNPVIAGTKQKSTVQNEMATFWSNVERDDDYDDDAMIFDQDNDLDVVYDDLFTDETSDYQDDVLKISSENQSSAGKTKSDFAPVKRIAILSERNSGAQWFSSSIQECFPDIEVTTSLSRPSPYFQVEDFNDSSLPTIVLPLFLNPYDWVNTMRSNPQFMPNHMKTRDWKEFVTKPWTLRKRTDSDIDLWEEINQDPDLHVCQMSFKYNEIMSCIKNEDDLTDGMDPAHYFASYELNQDGSGEPYKNIMDMRADKIMNYMSVMDWENIAMLLPVQYETLVEGGGFHFIVKEISDQSGLEPQCDLWDASFNAPIFWKKNYNVEFMDWMQENINWETERMIGYDVINAFYGKKTLTNANKEDKANTSSNPEESNAENIQVYSKPQVQHTKEESKGNWESTSPNEEESNVAYNTETYNNEVNWAESNSFDIDPPPPPPAYEEIKLRKKIIPSTQSKPEIEENYENLGISEEDIEIEIEIEENDNDFDVSHQDMKTYVLSKKTAPIETEYSTPTTYSDTMDPSGRGDLSYLAKKKKEENGEVESKKEIDVDYDYDHAEVSSLDPMPEELSDDDAINN